jgi:hypothetical protein
MTGVFPADAAEIPDAAGVSARTLRHPLARLGLDRRRPAAREDGGDEFLKNGHVQRVDLAFPSPTYGSTLCAPIAHARCLTYFARRDRARPFR